MRSSRAGVLVPPVLLKGTMRAERATRSALIASPLPPPVDFLNMAREASLRSSPKEHGPAKLIPGRSSPRTRERALLDKVPDLLVGLELSLVVERARS